MTKFALGEKVKDIVTGFSGIATSRVEYLNGCVQYCVSPPIDGDGKEVAPLYFDEGQLRKVGKGVLEKITSKPRGGPRGSAPVKYQG